jgi:hypothetical protein
MEHGKVTTVEYKDGVVYCNVRPMRTTSKYEALPVLKSHSGFIEIPKVGQQVMIDTLDDGTRFITDVLSKEEETPDEMSEGDLAIQLDGGTQLKFQKQSSGDYNLQISASGNVTIDGIDFDEHTHVDGDGATTSGPK